MIFNNLSDIEQIANTYGFTLDRRTDSVITIYQLVYQYVAVAELWKHTRLNKYKIRYQLYKEGYEGMEFCDKQEFEQFLKTVIQVRKKEKLQMKLAAIKKDFI